MDSRPILIGAKPIWVHLDSRAFDELLGRGERLATALLQYNGTDAISMVRSPLETDQNELQKVVEYGLLMKGSEVKSVEVSQGDSLQSSTFRHRAETIMMTARKLLKKDEVSRDELERIRAVFVQSVFSESRESSIYITNDELILKNRLWFESHYPGGILNIMSLAEASVLLDLLLKNNGRYCASGKYYLNKWYWYRLSMLEKVPHYNEGDVMIEALATRLMYALMAVDEMGIQYYLGPSSDARFTTFYHFNYLISLTTGIFDNLALATNERFGIGVTKPQMVGLSHADRYEKFLSKLERKSPELRSHISSNDPFIDLVYSFRELVVHREGLTETPFDYADEDAKWRANFIRIDKNQRCCIEACGDTPSELDPFTEWGIYRLDEEIFLEPYHFVPRGTRKLIEFVDRYLELMGFPLRDKTKPRLDDDSTRTQAFFSRYHLGF